jgi:hypothetical protein
MPKARITSPWQKQERDKAKTINMWGQELWREFITHEPRVRNGALHHDGPSPAALSVLTAMANAAFADSLDDVFGFSGYSYILDDGSCCDSEDSNTASIETITPLWLAGTHLVPAASSNTGKLIPPTPIMILFRPARTDYTLQTLLEIWAESDVWIMTGIQRQYWNLEYTPKIPSQGIFSLILS